jgi:tRNA U34 5-methylaminomethyl-2-thiouridine-forming methyltransferase MnmC
MQRDLILTRDGSHTVSVPGMNVTYHSTHGAIQESLHVFIDAGFRYLNPKGPLAIFEMGFGTGLNALLTLIEAEKVKQPVLYRAIELFPLDIKQACSLNYCNQLNRPELQPVFEQLHSCDWEKEIAITDHFIFQKSQTSLLDVSDKGSFNLIYFDAFAPAVQPELWTKEAFERSCSLLLPKGILVTYCSKSDVRRNMQAAGFTIEKIQGPHGKREMVRAVRMDSL